MTTRLDILTEGLTFFARLIIAARSDKDAAAYVTQIRSWGEVPRSEVDRIQAERIAELSGMLPPVDPELDPTIDARLREVDGHWVHDVTIPDPQGEEPRG